MLNSRFTLRLTMPLLTFLCACAGDSPPDTAADGPLAGLDGAVDLGAAELSTDGHPAGEAAAGGGCTPCTDVAACVENEAILCTGTQGDPNPCFSPSLWDCDATGNLCQTTFPAGVNGWSCDLPDATLRLVCTGPGQENRPPVTANWSCSYSQSAQRWRCEHDTPTNPCNSVEGQAQWSCSVVADATAAHVRCTR